MMMIMMVWVRPEERSDGGAVETNDDDGDWALAKEEETDINNYCDDYYLLFGCITVVDVIIKLRF